MSGAVRKIFMAVTFFLLSVGAVWVALFYVDRAPDRDNFGGGDVGKLEGYKWSRNDNDEEPEKSREADSVSSLEEKIAVEERRRESYIEGKALLSAESLLNALGENGVVLDNALKERLISGDVSSHDVDLLQLHIATVLTEEQSFYVELSQYTNFSEMHEAFKRREVTTGLFYGNEMLAEPATYKEASIEQIKTILDKGAVLPHDVIKHLIKEDNLELAEDLVALGYDMNLEFQDEFSSMNAVELLARNYTYNPLGSDPGKRANDIRRLADLGVPLDVADGTRDVLDIVLDASVKSSYEPSARRLGNLARNLIDMGVELDASHFQLLEKLEREKPYVYREVWVGG